MNDRLLLRPQGNREKATHTRLNISEAQGAGKVGRSVQRKATESDVVQNPPAESLTFIDLFILCAWQLCQEHNTVKE